MGDNHHDVAKFIELEEIESDRRNWAYVPSGLPVWTVVGYLKKSNWDKETAIDQFDGAASSADIDFAVSYYKQHQKEVDEQITSLTEA